MRKLKLKDGERIYHGFHCDYETDAALKDFAKRKQWSVSKSIVALIKRGLARSVLS